MKKVCIKCKLSKSTNEFYIHKTHKDRLRSECKECTKIRVKKYQNKHKKQVLNHKKVYHQLNRDKILKKLNKYYKTHKKERREYLEKNKNKIAIQYKKWYIKNKDKKSQYQIKRRKTNINARLSHCLRSRILNAIKFNSKSQSTMQLLGCSVEYLKKHLEKQFTIGMNWNNYGKWHIDHIKPCAKFDLSKYSEQKKCFNYTNLQPLWAKDNWSKCKKW
jgi:hypothetical protein